MLIVEITSLKRKGEKKSFYIQQGLGELLSIKVTLLAP